MKTLLQMISLAGILLTIVPPVLFFFGNISLSVQNTLMIIGAVVWFVSAGFWLGGKVKSS
jgi:high-affinity Fe2+/Pb2+ permease